MAVVRRTKVAIEQATVKAGSVALLAELSAVRAELERRQRFIDVLLETIEVGIVFCDGQGGSWVRNRAQRDLLGLDVWAAEGVAPETAAATVDVLDGRGRPVPVDDFPLLRALRGEDVGAVDLLLGPTGGPHTEVVSHSARILSAEGVVLGAVSTLTDVSAERASLRALADEHRRLVEAQQEAIGVGVFFDAVLTAAPDDMYVLDLTRGDLVYASMGKHAAVGAPGLDGPAAAGFGVTALGDRVSEEDLARLSAATGEVAQLLDGAVLELRYRAWRGSSWRWLGHRLTPFRREEDGVVVEVLAVVRDITAEVDAEERVAEADRVSRDAESRFQTVFDQAGVGALIVGLDGVPTRVNAAACALLGRPAELLVGRLWTDYNHPDDLPPGQLVQAELAAGNDSFGDERRYVRPDGSVVWASTHVTVVRDDEGAPDYILAQLADITERQRMEVELEHLALHDSLTGLPNRSLFVERVRQAVLDSTEPVAVVVVVVASLHTVIQRDGYAVGDLVLTEVARRLSRALSHDHVTIAHLQPGQFAVLLKGGANDALQAAELALAAMVDPFDLLEGTAVLRATAGISAATSHARAGTSLVGRLIQDAATAAARANADGPDGTGGTGGIAFASPAECEELDERHRMEALIHDALDHDKIRVAYQPVLDLSTGLIVGAEALLRIDDDQGSPIPPQNLISAMEGSGLIVEVGLRVLRLAAEQTARWHSEHDVWIPVAVNVSAIQLEHVDFLDNVLLAATRAGVPPEALSIELTESVLVKAGSIGIEKLRALRDAGINLAIDDFGTGYASLSYLQDLPASTLKIDRSFVAGIPHDRGAVAIVAAVIGLARNFGMTCIAEGIETDAQYQYLAERKIHGQGFLLGHPSDGTAIARLLATTPESPHAGTVPDAGTTQDPPEQLDTSGGGRDRRAELRDTAAARRDQLAEQRDEAGTDRDSAADRRDQDSRHHEDEPDPDGSPEHTDRSANERRLAATDRRHALRDRRSGATERTEAGMDRAAASVDRDAGARERVQAELDRNIALAHRGPGG